MILSHFSGFISLVEIIESSSVIVFVKAIFDEDSDSCYLRLDT